MAAPTFDAAVFLQTSGVSSASFSLTIGGACGNNAAIVDVGELNNTNVTVTGVTVDGNNAINVGGISDAFLNVRAEMWYRLNVTTGSRTIAVNFADSGNILVVGARSYCGVNQAAPIGTAATDADSSTTTGNVTVTSATGELVVDTIIAGDPTITIDASQNQRINQNDNVGPYFAMGASDKAGAASVTMQWTRGSATNWGQVGVSLKPVADMPRQPRVNFQPVMRAATF